MRLWSAISASLIAFAALIGCKADNATNSAVDVRSCTSPSISQKSIVVPGGQYQLGDLRFHVEERPIVTVRIASFEIDAHEVTNRQFAEFVEATGYTTRAERGLTEAQFNHLPRELRRSGSAVFSPPERDAPARAMNWWSFTEGAYWRAPEGPGSSIKDKDDYPVVHIAYEDAKAYAEWRGRRLPTEAEWEVAARGGVKGAPYAWGETPPSELEKPAANTWQGFFPYINNKKDGFSGLSPVGCFASNPYGVYDMIGNVWEWTSDPYKPRRNDSATTAGRALDDPESLSFNGVIKGGSYLCAENYCARFRPAARQSQERTFSASHIGFRTAADVSSLEGR